MCLSCYSIARFLYQYRASSMGFIVLKNVDLSYAVHAIPILNFKIPLKPAHTILVLFRILFWKSILSG